MTNTETGGSLEEAIRIQARENITEALWPDFEKEFNSIVEAARDQLRLKLENFPDLDITAERQAELTFNSWQNEKLAESAYAEYVEIMEEQSVPALSPSSFKTATSAADRETPLKRFLRIKEMGIKKGCTVVGTDKYAGHTGVVEGIHRFCTLHIPSISSRNRFSPLYWEVVEGEV